MLLIIPLDQEFLVQQVFGSVELRQFYSLKLSHLWNCQTLQDEKYLKNVYDAGTIAFHYTILYSLYSDGHHWQRASWFNETFVSWIFIRWSWPKHFFSNFRPLIYIFYNFRPLCVDLDNTMAINGNVCLCETNEEGSGRLCRRCGLERQASKAKVESWWRDWINSSFDHQSSAHNVRI